jgi:hypothetical protein
MELALGSARQSRGLVDSTNTGGGPGQGTHLKCSAACQRRVFGNLFACAVTGAEHLCDRCVLQPWLMRWEVGHESVRDETGTE